jgi:ABC-type lipoprotein export system ATPase subunit
LLSILGLLDTFDRGELEIDGRPSRDLGCPERWRAENVGIVFQFHHLLPHLTAAENVELPIFGLPRRSRLDRHSPRHLLEELSLGHRANTLSARLSGGERQIAAVARALVNRPRLMLADEPTGNVDSATGDLILNTLANWSRDTGGTLVVVTHDPAVADTMDFVVELHDGRVRESRSA